MMTLTEFLRNNPNIRCDCRVYLPDFDFNKLNEYIQKSEFLQSRRSLKWLCNNYLKIISGFYDTYARFDKNKCSAFKVEEFGYERTFTQADFDALIDNPENLEI